MRFELTQLFRWTALVAILFGAIRLAFAVPSTSVPLVVLGGTLVLSRVVLGSTRLVLELATALGLLALLNMVFAYQTQEIRPTNFYDNFVGYPLSFAAAGAVLGLVASGLLSIGNAVVRLGAGPKEEPGENDS